MKYPKDTRRLTFRRMQMGDVDNLLYIFNDPVAMKYYPSVKNKEETIRWITWTINNYHKFGVGLWIVEEKGTGKFLGQCGIVPQKIDGEVQMEIGYLFIREEWGRGVATEAAKACLDFCFSRLKIKRVISIIDPGNQASIAVAEKLGMYKEKTIDKWGKELILYAVEA